MISKEKLIYLAHPYTNDPIKWNGFAENYTLFLLKQGFHIFSPILHTHNFDVDMAEKHRNVGMKWNPPEYVRWDLSILNAMKGNVIILMSNEAYVIPSDRMQYRYEAERQTMRFGATWSAVWTSQGCRREYEYAMTRGIPVYDLEAFVDDGKEIAL